MYEHDVALDTPTKFSQLGLVGRRTDGDAELGTLVKSVLF